MAVSCQLSDMSLTYLTTPETPWPRPDNNTHLVRTVIGLDDDCHKRSDMQNEFPVILRTFVYFDIPVTVRTDKCTLSPRESIEVEPVLRKSVLHKNQTYTRVHANQYLRALHSNV